MTVARNCVAAVEDVSPIAALAAKDTTVIYVIPARAAVTSCCVDSLGAAALVERCGTCREAAAGDNRSA